MSQEEEMKVKFWQVLTVTVVFCLILAACQPQPTPAPAPAVEEVQPTEAPPPVEEPTVAEEPEPTEAAEPAEGAIDCMGAQAGDKLTVMYQWSGGEEEKINAIFKPLVDACGISIVAESTRDLAVLDTKVQSTPPDILFWPTTAPLSLYRDKLKELSTVGANADNYAKYWVEMGSQDGKWFAIPVKADIKTIIWYSPTQFEAFGYQTPTTFDELDALVEKMVADGNIPWSMGMESGAATGWTGSDFIQDLLLVQQGPEYVSKLITGEVAYNDAGVLKAYQTYSKWASDPKYTVGGGEGTVSTPFLDAIYKVFSDKPEAMMVKQSGFAGGEIVKKYSNLEYGVDFDFFQFPGAKGMQGGADFMMAFDETPAAKAMVAYLTGAAGAETWATTGFDLSPNKLAVGKYTDAQLTKKAEMLANASGFTPDLGDTIPAPFGEAEWKAVIVAAQAGNIQAALDTAAKAQAEALKK
jgi:alpha-glucoside transport system substrate-binding protein